MIIIIHYVIIIETHSLSFIMFIMYHSHYNHYVPIFQFNCAYYKQEGLTLAKKAFSTVFCSVK